MEITDLDMAAAIIAGTGIQPALSRNLDGLMVFTFQDNAATRNAVAAYAIGGSLPAKHLLKTRGALYKRLMESKGKRS